MKEALGGKKIFQILTCFLKYSLLAVLLGEYTFTIVLLLITCTFSDGCGLYCVCSERGTFLMHETNNSHEFLLGFSWILIRGFSKKTSLSKVRVEYTLKLDRWLWEKS